MSSCGLRNPRGLFPFHRSQFATPTTPRPWHRFNLQTQLFAPCPAGLDAIAAQGAAIQPQTPGQGEPVLTPTTQTSAGQHHLSHPGRHVLMTYDYPWEKGSEGFL